MTDQESTKEQIWTDALLLDHINQLEANAKILIKELHEERHWRRWTMIALGVAFAAILFVGVFAAIVLNSIQNAAAEDRAGASEFRRQLADCTVRPGATLSDGFVNPGICFSDAQGRTSAAIDGAVADIREEVRKLLVAQDEATAANRRLADQVRSDAAAQARVLRNLPPTPQTTTTRTTLPPTTTTRPPPTTTTTTTTAPQRGVVCDVLSILGLCGDG